jgi:hypothetical protein
LTLDAWDGFALAGAFAHSASVGLAWTVVDRRHATLGSGSPTFLAPFGVVLDWSDASVAPWSGVAIGDDMVFVVLMYEIH